jgi:hypothetical protein
MRLVREILTHPKIFPWITDDGSPARSEYQPPDHPAIWYVLVFDGEELLGLWMFVPENCATLKVHTCLLPGHGFHRARRAARLMAQWIWDHTTCQRIITDVPRFNRAAAAFARAAGMTEFGTNFRSFLKQGTLHDQILLGMSRPENIQCQQQ